MNPSPFATGTSRTVTEGYQCQAGQIDDHGRVFGFVQPQGGHPWRAFVWHDGKRQVVEAGSSMEVINGKLTAPWADGVSSSSTLVALGPPTSNRAFA